MTTYRHCRYGGWIAIEGTPYRRAFRYDHPLQDTEWYVRQDRVWFSRAARAQAALTERKDLTTAPDPGFPPDNVHRAVWGLWRDVGGVAYREVVRVPGTDPYDDVYVADYRNDWYVLTQQEDGTQGVSPVARPSWAPYELPGHPMLDYVPKDPVVTYGPTIERDGVLYTEYTVASSTVYLVRFDLETYRVTASGTLERCLVPEYLRDAFRRDGAMPRYGAVERDGRLLYRKAYEMAGVPEAPGWFVDAFGTWYVSWNGSWYDRSVAERPVWATWLPSWIPFDLEDDGPEYGPWFRRGRQDYRAAMPKGQAFDGTSRTLQDATGRYYTQRKKDGAWGKPKILNVPPDWCPGPHRIDPDAPLDRVFDASVAKLAQGALRSPFLAALATKDDPYPTVHRVSFVDVNGIDRDVDVARASVCYELTEDETLTVLERGGLVTDVPELAERLAYEGERLVAELERDIVHRLLAFREQYGWDAPEAETTSFTAASVVEALASYDMLWKGHPSRSPRILLVTSEVYTAMCQVDGQGASALGTLKETAPTLEVLTSDALHGTGYDGLITVADASALELVRTCAPVNLYRGADPYTGTHVYLLFTACAPCMKTAWAVLPLKAQP